MAQRETGTERNSVLLLQRRSWYDKPLLLPLAASLTLLLSPFPAHAGILSGFFGLESVPGPELPKLDALTRFNEENQKRYAENDARFRESPLVKELLERSKLNKEKMVKLSTLIYSPAQIQHMGCFILEFLLASFQNKQF